MITDQATSASASRWKRHFERIAAQGIASSLSYYLFTVGLESLGVSIMRLFKHERGAALCERSSSIVFSVVQSMAEWTERDREALLHYGGDTLWADFEQAFARQELCAIARSPGDRLACVCWLTQLRGYVLSPHEACFLIQRCFTLPEFRGRDLYPMTLSFACDYLREHYSGIQIFIECSRFNASSTRGILKAGFRPAGTRIGVCGYHWSTPPCGRRQVKAL